MCRVLRQVQLPHQLCGVCNMVTGARAATSLASPSSRGMAQEVPSPPQQRKMQKLRQNSALKALELLQQQKGRVDPDALRRHIITLVPRASAE